MKISLIAAVAENGIIGVTKADGTPDMPWHLPDDFAFFKRKTSHHAIILGRKTLDALGGKPLPNRSSIVVTRNTSYHMPNVTVVHTLEDALTAARQVDADTYQSGEIFVIGGAEIYAQAMPVATTLYLTEIHKAYPGDVHFPAFDRAEWQEVSRTPHPADARHEVGFDFVEYERT